jgi:AbrB family looped-hinge helix DNA binding protein
MKTTTRLSTKGQVVLPKSIRAARRWKPGAEFVVQERDDGVLLKPKGCSASRDWSALVGCVAYKGPRKTIKQMDESVAARMRGQRW